VLIRLRLFDARILKFTPFVLTEYGPKEAFRGRSVNNRPPTDDEWSSFEKWDRVDDYPEYLGSDEWSVKREYMLRRAGHRCQVCNSEGPLDIHHRTYERTGHEVPDDLIALCRACHQSFHDSGRLAKG